MRLMVRMTKYKNMHIYILLIFTVIIAILTFKEIKSNMCISIIGDEFGYWSGAAFLLDKPWRSVVSTNSYYGWGYGILLAPIMFFCKDNASMMYQISIFLNGLMLCGVLFIVYSAALKIFEDKNKIMCSIMAGAVTIFPSSIYEIFNSMPEILLALLTWFSFYLSIIMYENKKCKLIYSYILIFIGAFAFSVHQRAIGLLVVNLFIAILYYMQRNIHSFKKLLVLLSFLLCLIAMAVVIKNKYLGWLYSAASLEGSLENDFSSVITSKKDFLSFHAIKSLAISIIGKVYYFGSTTFLFGIVGIVSCFRNLKRNLHEINLEYAFACLHLVQAVVISSVFMMGGFESRTDILIYGRYIEYAMMPLMLIGIIGLVRKKCTMKEACLIISIYLLLTIVVSKNIASDSINTNMGNIFALADAFCIKNMNNDVAIFYNGLRAIITFVLTYLLIVKSKGNYTKSVAMLAIVFINVYTFISVYEGNTLLWQKKANECTLAVESYKQQKQEGDSLYIYDGGIGTKMVQFLLPNEECIRIDNPELVDEDALILTQYNKENEDKISNEHEIIYRNSIVILWRK